MLKSFKIACALSLGLLAPPVHAANQGLQFNSTVTHTCSINVTRSGTLDLVGNYQRFTTRTGPGTPGAATVVASGNGFTLSTDAATSFNTQPVANTTPQTFRAWHRSRGATVYNQTQNAMSLNHGQNEIRIHMDARKTGTDVFEAGDYSATVILRCE